MEKPEKIYFDGEGKACKLPVFASTNIEYVNKDAFIEKACEWIKENITNNPNANSVLVRKGCVTLGMLIKNFKKYMEE